MPTDILDHENVLKSVLKLQRYWELKQTWLELP